MRIGVIETVQSDAGFEIEFDRVLIEEFLKAGHAARLFAPQGSRIGEMLGTPAVSLNSAPAIQCEQTFGLPKFYLSVQRAIRRVKWFDETYELLHRGEIDCAVFTTATFRYLKTLQNSKLRFSTKPVVFIFLGIAPKEKPDFLAYVRRLSFNKNLVFKVVSLRDDFANEAGNVSVIPPPVLIPEEVVIRKEGCRHRGGILKFGMFGFNRRSDKNLRAVIETVLKMDMTHSSKIQLHVQYPLVEDIKDFIGELTERWANGNEVEVINRKLHGMEWYDALNSMDAIILPYVNDRYLYNWSAVYFNAIGLYKPVLCSSVVNPEVLRDFHIGMQIDMANQSSILSGIEQLIHALQAERETYTPEFDRANEQYSKAKFIERLLNF